MRSVQKRLEAEREVFDLLVRQITAHHNEISVLRFLRNVERMVRELRRDYRRVTLRKQRPHFR